MPKGETIWICHRLRYVSVGDAKASHIIEIVCIAYIPGVKAFIEYKSRSFKNLLVLK